MCHICSAAVWACISVCLYICTCVYVYLSIYLCNYLGVYIHIYIYIYIIHTRMTERAFAFVRHLTVWLTSSAMTFQTFSPDHSVVDCSLRGTSLLGRKNEEMCCKCEMRYSKALRHMNKQVHIHMMSPRQGQGNGQERTASYI
jgi:hypothetical protein